MPIGQGDIPVLGNDAQNLVEALFSAPPGAPTTRAFLSPLIQLANTSSGGNFGASVAPFFAPPPPLGAGALVPTAVPSPAVATVQDFISLLNPPELQSMLDTWQQIWNGGGVGNPSDVALINTLRGYIADPQGAGAVPPLAMWLPQLSYDGMNGEQIKFRLIGYNQVLLNVPGAGPIVWNAANVRLFLQYLAFGAHFVTVHAPANLPPLMPPLQAFYTVFGNALGGQSRAAKAHSHYGGLGPLTNIGAAYAYPDLINAETAPVNCPYIVAFLVGRTAWNFGGSNWNSFFQLEGWPTTGLTGLGGRHGADFAAHTASKWNISTYGASLYSEKRGTTVFLAPASWHAATGGPQPQLPTIMVPYVGAETPQRWLDTNLIRL